MSLVALAAMLAAPVPPAPDPLPGLSFGHIRMLVFQNRAHELHCPAGDLDRELQEIVRLLQARYGKKAFPAHTIPSGGPGECWAVLSVYRVNLADFRRQAEAALNGPAAAAPPAAPAAAPSPAPRDAAKAANYAALQAYWSIYPSRQCVQGDLAARFAAAKARLDGLATAYMERAQKRGTWTPPPMFGSSAYPCSEAAGRVAEFEARVEDLRTSLAKD